MPDRLLILFLRLSAAVLLLALIAVFIPFSWMNSIHERLGLGELADQPMVSYLARLASALYGAEGIVFIFLSFDVRRYLPFLRLLGWGKIAFGVLMTGIDIACRMPVFWTAVEGPVLVGFGLILLWLTSRVPEKVS